MEFAFVAPVLCFMLLSLVELGMLGMMVSGLDNAVIEVARLIRTGQDTAPASAAAFKDQICTQMGGSYSDCINRLAVGVQRYSNFTDANAVVTAAPDGTYNKGAANDIMLVKVDYQWPLMTPFLATAFNRNGPMSVTLSSRLAFKNEPYQ